MDMTSCDYYFSYFSRYLNNGISGALFSARPIRLPSMNVNSNSFYDDSKELRMVNIENYHYDVFLKSAKSCRFALPAYQDPFVDLYYGFVWSGIVLRSVIQDELRTATNP